jgi:hypothetical protein
MSQRPKWLGAGDEPMTGHPYYRRAGRIALSDHCGEPA